MGRFLLRLNFLHAERRRWSRADRVLTYDAGPGSGLAHLRPGRVPGHLVLEP